MPNIDGNDVFAALSVALTADAAITALLGNPPRVFDAVRKDVNFPWTRVDTVEMAPAGGTRRRGVDAPGIDWIHQYGLQFVTQTLEKSKAAASDILKAISDVLDFAPTKLVVAGAKCFESKRGAQDLGYDPVTGNGFSFGAWVLVFDPL